MGKWGNALPHFRIFAIPHFRNLIFPHSHITLYRPCIACFVNITDLHTNLSRLKIHADDPERPSAEVPPIRV